MEYVSRVPRPPLDGLIDDLHYLEQVSGHDLADSRISSPAGIAGAVGGGLLTRRYGRSRVLALSCAGQAVALSAFLPLSSGYAPLPLTVTVLCLFGGAYAAGSVAVNTVIMDLSRRELAASDFTVLTVWASSFHWRPVLSASPSPTTPATDQSSSQP